MRRFAAEHPDQWQDVRQVLVRMIWETYLGRWRDSYQHRSSSREVGERRLQNAIDTRLLQKGRVRCLSSVKTKVKATLRRRIQ